MKIYNKEIAGVFLVENTLLEDPRGAFSRFFCDKAMEPVLAGRIIKQINWSHTCRVGALRGMHYQNPPYAEMKIIRCLKGRVFDVVVDLRANSPTFLQWLGVELTPQAAISIAIPEGCAHGFQVLEEDSTLLYLHTAPYTPSVEGGVRFDDPRVSIRWPLTPVDISPRDIGHPYLSENFKGIFV